MKQEQFINAVMLSFNVDYLNLEDEIAILVNSDKPLKEKVAGTKVLVGQMVAIENNINKFKQLFIKEEVTPETANGQV